MTPLSCQFQSCFSHRRPGYRTDSRCQTPSTGLRHISRRRVPESDARSVSRCFSNCVWVGAALRCCMCLIIVRRFKPAINDKQLKIWESFNKKQCCGECFQQLIMISHRKWPNLYLFLYPIHIILFSSLVIDGKQRNNEIGNLCTCLLLTLCNPAWT